jgi:Xaa-Pro dipeptidase
MNKRSFLKLTSLSAAGLLLPSLGRAASADKPLDGVASLKPITADALPISVAEMQERIGKAQRLMQQQGVHALVLEPGAAMVYFTGIQWWRSERLTAVVIPKKGDIAVVCPFFEEPSIRESLQVGDDVRVWQEHQSPFMLIRQILQDRGISQGTIGFENSVRYFVLDGVMSLLPGMSHSSAEPITRACRMYKSAHELILMHKANEITLKAYEFVYSQLAMGMSQGEVKGLMTQAMLALGGKSPWSMALFNEASAYPHGTKQSQTIGDGSVVLMDCGCAVQGYQADISRTFVFGEANKKQKDVWAAVRQGQQIAFEQAQLGNTAGSVDTKVRAYYHSLGYGPEYALPGLSHRTGHGIGMEGHESVNFVTGETTKLAPGMCFSDEPGIYLPGEFGVRLEDCLYMTASGPRWFTQPAESLDKPLGKVAPLVL